MTIEKGGFVMLLIFYLSAYLYSWLIWIIGIVFIKTTINPYILISVGGLGPVIGVLIYFILQKSEKVKKDYFRRLIKIDNIKTSIWLIALFLPFIVVALSNLIDYTITSTTLAGLRLLPIDQKFLDAGLFYPIFLVFFGPIPEELGWRGVAFEELLQRVNYYKAQLIVAIFWALWHLPLFFIEGSYQNNLGVFTLPFWMFNINILSNSFITGWIYIKSNRSLLVAILFHYTINLSGEMIYMTAQGNVIRLIVFIVFVILVELYDRLSSARNSARIRVDVS